MHVSCRLLMDRTSTLQSLRPTLLQTCKHVGFRLTLTWKSLGRAQKILQEYRPRASIVPAALNFTDCPFMWPFCRQPLYAHAMPLMFNATVLNGMGLIGARMHKKGSGTVTLVALHAAHRPRGTRNPRSLHDTLWCCTHCIH